MNIGGDWGEVFGNAGEGEVMRGDKTDRAAVEEGADEAFRAEGAVMGVGAAK